MTRSTAPGRCSCACGTRSTTRPPKRPIQQCGGGIDRVNGSRRTTDIPAALRGGWPWRLGEPVEGRLRAADHLIRLTHPLIESGQFKFFPLRWRRRQPPAQRRSRITGVAVFQLSEGDGAPARLSAAAGYSSRAASVARGQGFRTQRCEVPEPEQASFRAMCDLDRYALRDKAVE